MRKLFATIAATGDNFDETTFSNAVKDLAELDAHSAKMAMTIHYNLSDRITGSVINKSRKAFYSTMKRMPLEFPDEALNQDEFQHILSNMGKRSFKRKAPEPDAGDGDLETGAAGPETPMEKKRRMRERIRIMGEKMVEDWEGTQFRSWMMKQIVDDLWLEGEEVTYLQVRYALTGK